MYSQSYDYDEDSALVGRTVVRGGTVEEHAYGYDTAGRLTSWTKPGGEVVSYGWDENGNRVSAGGQTFVYDERNRLRVGPDGEYQWSARGTLERRTDASEVMSWEFDALGRSVGFTPASGPRDGFGYDGLDRVASRDGSAFAYSGDGWKPVGDGVQSFSRGPAGDLVAVGGVDGAALTLMDRHGDLVAGFDAQAGLVGSRSYSPFGEVESAWGEVGTALGFQGDWTDPVSDEVWQGARWYQPATATFTSRDTVFGELDRPVSLNRYTYAFADPLNYFDPDGRFAVGVMRRLASLWRSVQAVRSAVRVAVRVSPQARRLVSAVRSVARRVASSSVGRTVARVARTVARVVRPRANPAKPPTGAVREAERQAQDRIARSQERLRQTAMKEASLRQKAAAFLVGGGLASREYAGALHSFLVRAGDPYQRPGLFQETSSAFADRCAQAQRRGPNGCLGEIANEAVPVRRGVEHGLAAYDAAREDRWFDAGYQGAHSSAAAFETALWSPPRQEAPSPQIESQALSHARRRPAKLESH